MTRKRTRAGDVLVPAPLPRRKELAFNVVSIPIPVMRAKPQSASSNLTGSGGEEDGERDMSIELTNDEKEICRKMNNYPEAAMLAAKAVRLRRSVPIGGPVQRDRGHRALAPAARPNDVSH